MYPIGRKIYTWKGKNKWSTRKWGIIVGVGNENYYIVRFPHDGRKTWIRKDWILFWN